MEHLTSVLPTPDFFRQQRSDFDWFSCFFGGVLVVVFFIITLFIIVNYSTAFCLPVGGTEVKNNLPWPFSIPDNSYLQ